MQRIQSFLATTPKVLDRLHDSVISTTLDGIIADCNAAAEKLYGWPREELIGKSVSIFYRPSDSDRMLEVVGKVHQTGMYEGELLNVTRDGSELYIHLSVTLIRDAQNQPIGMIGFSIDMTEARKAEVARRQNEAINQAAREAASLGTWYWDLNANELRWDGISSALLGLDPRESQGLEVFISLVHEKDRQRISELLKRCIDTRTEYEAEYRVRWKDGTQRWIYGRGRIVCDEAGTPTTMLGVATDITSRKNTEETLRTAEAKYSVLFHSPVIGVASGNLDRFTDVNEAFCQMVGYTREELVSGEVRWQDMTPPEFLPLDYAALQQLSQKGVATPFQKEYICKDGRRIRAILGAALVSRDPFAWSCFILDISHQHNAMMALRSSEQLAAAAKMGSALAHEINNPLAALTNIIYLMQYGSTERSSELLSTAEEALERVSRITRQMIGIYSEAERVSEIRVSQVLDDALAGCSARIKAKNLRIEKRDEFGTRALQAVDADLRRLVSALLDNAVEHTPPGGNIKVHIFPSRDWSSDQTEGVRIVVLDDGPGIPKSNQQFMFEPFFSTKKDKASGLGLWASRTIVQKYNGRMKIRSRTDGRPGTCVSVFLEPMPDAKKLSA